MQRALVGTMSRTGSLAYPPPPQAATVLLLDNLAAPASVRPLCCPSARERSSCPDDEPGSAPSDADGDSQDRGSARSGPSPAGLLVSEPPRGKGRRRSGRKHASASGQCVTTTPSLYEMLRLLLAHGTLRDPRDGQYVKAGQQRGQCHEPLFEQATRGNDAVP